MYKSAVEKEELYLDEYRNYVRRLASEHSSDIIYNADKKHAAILLGEIIRSSKESLQIICQNMDPLVTEKPDYINAMTEFLDRGSPQVKILMTDYYRNKDIFDNSEIFNLLKKHKNQVTLKYMEESDLNLVYIGDNLLNFTTSDDIAYRFETDVYNNMALGCFNDRETVKVLNEKFSVLFNHCENKISLQ